MFPAVSYLPMEAMCAAEGFSIKKRTEGNATSVRFTPAADGLSVQAPRHFQRLRKISDNLLFSLLPPGNPSISGYDWDFSAFLMLWLRSGGSAPW